MRNATKLKHILHKYDLTFTLPEEDLFRIIMIDKISNRQFVAEGTTYSKALGKVFSLMMNDIKKSEEGNL